MIVHIMSTQWTGLIVLSYIKLMGGVEYIQKVGIESILNVHLIRYSVMAKKHLNKQKSYEYNRKRVDDDNTPVYIMFTIMAMLIISSLPAYFGQ